MGTEILIVTTTHLPRENHLAWRPAPPATLAFCPRNSWKPRSGRPGSLSGCPGSLPGRQQAFPGFLCARCWARSRGPATPGGILPPWGSQVGRWILTKHEPRANHGAGLPERERRGLGGARRPRLRKGTRCVTHSCLPRRGTHRSEQAPTRRTVQRPAE